MNTLSVQAYSCKPASCKMSFGKNPIMEYASHSMANNSATALKMANDTVHEDFSKVQATKFLKEVMSMINEKDKSKFVSAFKELSYSIKDHATARGLIKAINEINK